MDTQTDMMIKALSGGAAGGPGITGQMQQPPTEQAMHPIGTPVNPQAQPNAMMGGMGGMGMLGAGGNGLLQMLMQGGGQNGLMNMLRQKKDSDGNPQAAADTPSPGTFTPGGQSNPSSTSVTPF